jgi:hypothetical protein
MDKTILFLILLSFVSPSYGATIYQWVDNHGTYNFTDDHEKVPSAYRNQVRVKNMEDFPEMGPPAVPSTSKAAPRREEVKKDILGLGEEWWREKARPWEGNLEEASENYRATNEQFLNESDNLILRKFGSHQQFKSTILGMERIKEERAIYEAKVIEAEGMLERISREAEESKADPDWLTGAPTPGQRASLYRADMDTYGRDEAWWRQKVLTQRDQLKEAVENYEKVYKEYSKEAERLGPSRFGRLSLTQYQMTSLRLDSLRDEIARYRLQVSEATETLKKLLKEAEESKADPDWVK